MLRLIAVVLAGCVSTTISVVTPDLDVPQALVTTDFTGGSACLNGPLVTPIYCTVFDGAGYIGECEGFDVACWNAIADAECASGFQIVIVSELPVATSAAYEAICWSR